MSTGTKTGTLSNEALSQCDFVHLQARLGIGQLGRSIMRKATYLIAAGDTHNLSKRLSPIPCTTYFEHWSNLSYTSRCIPPRVRVRGDRRSCPLAAIDILHAPEGCPLARLHCVAAAGRVCPVGGQDSRGASRTLLHYTACQRAALQAAARAAGCHRSPSSPNAPRLETVCCMWLAKCRRAEAPSRT